MMNSAKRRGPRQGVQALNAMFFIKINGDDDELFDRIKAAKSWAAAKHSLVDEDTKGRGLGRFPTDPDDENEIDMDDDALNIDEESNENLEDIPDEFDQLHVSDDS